MQLGKHCRLTLTASSDARACALPCLLSVLVVTLHNTSPTRTDSHYITDVTPTWLQVRTVYCRLTLTASREARACALPSAKPSLKPPIW